MKVAITTCAQFVNKIIMVRRSLAKRSRIKAYKTGLKNSRKLRFIVVRNARYNLKRKVVVPI